MVCGCVAPRHELRVLSFPLEFDFIPTRLHSPALFLSLSFGGTEHSGELSILGHSGVQEVKLYEFCGGIEVREVVSIVSRKECLLLAPSKDGLLPALEETLRMVEAGLCESSTGAKRLTHERSLGAVLFIVQLHTSLKVLPPSLYLATGAIHRHSACRDGYAQRERIVLPARALVVGSCRPHREGHGALL